MCRIVYAGIAVGALALYGTTTMAAQTEEYRPGQEVTDKGIFCHVQGNTEKIIDTVTTKGFPAVMTVLDSFYHAPGDDRTHACFAAKVTYIVKKSINTYPDVDVGDGKVTYHYLAVQAKAIYKHSDEGIDEIIPYDKLLYAMVQDPKGKQI